MATHIIIVFNPLDGMEDLLSLFSACSDEDLFACLSEIESEDSVSWHQAGNDFKASMLSDALSELKLAREELRLAELQFQTITRDLEEIQVLDDMAKHARRISDETTRKLQRLEKFIEYAQSSEAIESSEEVLEKATLLKAKLQNRLAQWSDSYASELEDKLRSAKRKFLARRLSIDDAREKIFEAKDALRDAEALVASFQS